MAELSDILEKFKTPILISKIVQCGLSVLNVVKSISFRIGWTTGNHRGFCCIDYSQKYAESKRTLKQTSSGHFS